MERTFVAIKPDAVQRSLIGEIVARFEKKGFKISALKLIQLDEATAKKHYAEHEGKPFFQNLVDFITSGPIVAMVIEGNNSVTVVRKMLGVTNPAEASPGTIRGDYAQITEKNIIHGSDSIQSAEREIAIFFKEEEILSDFAREIDRWLIK
jgi:nucleoside-diphosphate kinase